MNTTAVAPTSDITDPKQQARVRRVLRKGAFAVLSTVSPAGRPHAAGVVYDTAPGEDALYVHTMRSSRKARNIAENAHVGVVVSVKRVPMAPPYTVQFQGFAELIDMDDRRIVGLLAAGHLSTVSGHGALDEPDGVFVRITPDRRVHTYGIGVSTLALARDPLHVGARTVEL
ncbi:MAG: hypothetical protein CL424_18840 [Acidimicrobiaceae bacterium]|nr:hypothetical protein [Acidimicrobiaceae bacterium]